MRTHGVVSENNKKKMLGDLSCFSFYYAHHMSTIEGGMVCTDDEESMSLRMLRVMGWLEKWIILKKENLD